MKSDEIELYKMQINTLWSSLSFGENYNCLLYSNQNSFATKDYAVVLMWKKSPNYQSIID